MRGVMSVPMTHFTVSVIIQGAEENELGERLEKMMLPYMEFGPVPLEEHPREYRQFKDTEDEFLEQYETESTEMIRLDDGDLAYPWDKRFKSDVFGRAEPPAHLERVEIPHRERYATFEEFCKDWHSAERDVEHGRYGHWENEQGYWDWYEIGGRWRGLLMTKDGRERDCARLKDLDLDGALNTERDKRLDFISKLNAFYANGMKGDDDPFDGTRSLLLKLGILDCANLEEIPALEAKHGPIPEKRRRRWDHPNYQGPERYDLLIVDPEVVDQFWLENHDGGMFHPFYTYALLDENGWHQPGAMGWWACSSATPESRENFGAFFGARLKRAVRETPDAFLVVVDCHV